MRIVFAGTPVFAAHILQALITQHDVVCVYTQPDRPAGRGRKPKASSVKILANSENIPVEQPEKLKGDALETLIELRPDVIVVAAYGLILSEKVLSIPKYGCINVHASLLPKYRGAAPIQRAIQNGDRETGVTIMQMDKGMDTGDMLLKVSCAIESNDTAQTLHDKLANISPAALLTTLTKIEAGQLIAEKQKHTEASYANKITKEEAKLNWSFPAEQLCLNIRAFNPWPGCFTTLDDKLIKIWQASESKSPGYDSENHEPGQIVSVNKNITVATKQGLLKIEKLQLAGGKIIEAKDALNSYKDLFNVGKQFN